MVGKFPGTVGFIGKRFSEDGRYLSIDAGIPESFNVLVREIRSLGIDIDYEKN